MDKEDMPASTAEVKKVKKTRNHLVYVAWAFIFIGTLALIQTIQSFVNEPFAAPNFLMVFIVVGWGLLKRKPLWRTFALSCAYVFFIFTAGKVLIVMRTPDAMANATLSQVSMFWGINILMICAGAYAIWALQTKGVREQFKSNL